MKKTNATLESLDGLQRAEMPAALRARLEALIPAAARPRIVIFHKPALLLAAAGLALLIGLNVLVLARQGRDAPRQGTGSSQAIADQYFAPAPSL